MAVINAVAWPLRLLAVGLVTAGLGTSVYFLAQSGDADDERFVVAGTATAGETSVTQTPPAAPETPAPPTQVPTTGAPPPTVASPEATLAPPPPKPEQPSEVKGGEWDSLAGGQWYRLLGCIDFYLPTGRTFSLQVGSVDPGGGVIVFSDHASGGSLSFHRDSLEEWVRTDISGDLGPAFDQIAQTISTIC